MGDTHAADGWYHVADNRIQAITRVVFMGSLLLFLVNILLGFLNVFTTGELPHWQLITHFHAATLGWLTLSVVGLVIWQFSNTRDLAGTTISRVRQLGWAAVLVIAGYIASFGIGFYTMGNAYYLLPVFGTLVMLVIWATAYYALTQVRGVPTVTTVHLLWAGGITLAAFGAVAGVTRGLQLSVGSLGLPTSVSVLAAHATAMDVYAILITAGIIEWLVVDDQREYRWHGILQAGLWVLAGFLGFVGNIVGSEALAGIASLVGLLVVTVIFLIRIGWRAIAATPMGGIRGSWAFFSTVWLVVFVGGFLSIIAGLINPDTADWAGPVIFHALYMGAITNAIFGVYSVRTSHATDFHALAEPAALWLLNLGMVVFFATEYAMGSRHGALIMGLGVLLAVGTMLYRLYGETAAPEFDGGFEPAVSD